MKWQRNLIFFWIKYSNFFFFWRNDEHIKSEIILCVDSLMFEYLQPKKGEEEKKTDGEKLGSGRVIPLRQVRMILFFKSFRIFVTILMLLKCFGLFPI